MLNYKLSIADHEYVITKAARKITAAIPGFHILHTGLSHVGEAVIPTRSHVKESIKATAISPMMVQSILDRDEPGWREKYVSKAGVAS